MSNAVPTAAPAQPIARQVSPRRAAWKRTFRQLRRSRLALPAGFVLVIFVLAALFAPLIAPYDPFKNDLANALLPPSSAHWMGSDELGRDLFSRIVYGARLSFMAGIASVAISMLIGVPLGMISGYVGGKTDAVIMRVMDVILAFPGVLLAIAIISIAGATFTNAVIGVAVNTVPIFARVARGSTMSVKEEAYIEACRALGTSDFRILWRHILPNISASLSVLATLRVGISILVVASLSFLGLGAQAPLPEWGAMLSNGRTYILIAPHLVIFPGVAIILLVLAINLFQDGLRLALDPKSANR